MVKKDSHFIYSEYLSTASVQLSFLLLNTYIINIPAVAGALADGAACDVPVLSVAAADQAVANLCCC
jgi:hypothetical protein